MIRSDTDDLWTKIESLQWVLFVIFALRNKKMVIIWLRASSYFYGMITISALFFNIYDFDHAPILFTCH